MTFTVVWKSAAKQQLAEIWVEAADRAAVAAAADAIDAALRVRPQTCGESRGDNFRVVVEMPLAAFFAVSQEDRLVTVFFVRDLAGRA